MNTDTNNFAPVVPKGSVHPVADAAKPRNLPTGADSFSDGRLEKSGLSRLAHNQESGGSNPSPAPNSIHFRGSARIDVHPGASQPSLEGNDEAGLSAEMFRDKPHVLRASGVRCTKLVCQPRTRFNSASRPPTLPKTRREAAARPKCAGNETGYKPHDGSSPVGVAESFAGSDGLQPVTSSKTQRQTGGYLGAAAKPDSSPAKISPKCCLPFTFPNQPTHPVSQSKAHGNTAVSSRSDRPHSPFDKDKPRRRPIPRPSSPSFVAGFCHRRQHARRSDYSQHTAFPFATCQPPHFMVPMPEVRCNGPLTWQ